MSIIICKEHATNVEKQRDQYQRSLHDKEVSKILFDICAKYNLQH